MNALPRRLHVDALNGRAGSWINRDRRIKFSFDGQSLQGFEGDSLASALLGAGVRLVGRSFKYHRPRGLVSADSDEPNGLVAINQGNRQEPNLPATTVALYDGLIARSQNRVPSLRFDIKALAGSAAPLLPSGFYYKTFIRPKQGWMFYEAAIRRMAGLGIAATEPDPDYYEHFHADCDLLIIGAGIAGLTAANAAAASGARIIIAESNPHPGGLGDAGGGSLNDTHVNDYCRQQAAAIAGANIQLLTRTTAIGVYSHNYVIMLQAVEHGSGPSHLRYRLWRLRAKQIIVATGALERPLVFCGNDAPGIVKACAARLYALRYGVAVGRRGVVFTNNDDAYRTALTLHEAGIGIAAIVDCRPDAASPLIDRANAAGLPLMRGHIVTRTQSTFGSTSIAGVKVAGLRASGRISLPERFIRCDFVAVSGGWDAAPHLFCHNGGRAFYDTNIAGLRPDPASAPSGIVCTGSAAGHFNLTDIITDAHATAIAAVQNLVPTRPPYVTPPLPKIDHSQEARTQPLWIVPAPGRYARGHKHFVDWQNDVTVADLELAIREGFDVAELMKRYTTTGMATDQGKNSNLNALAILADARGIALEQMSPTTFRPPYTPVPFGAVAGTQRAGLYKPIRETALATWHREAGATFEPVGLWRRPYCYPRRDETKAMAINREVLLVRHKVGLFDASTLGKILVKGPDAAIFLDRIYTNRMSTLKRGHCRYGLMCNEKGFLFDDGVAARLDEDRYLLHTTSGNADHIYDHLEEWAQTEWPELRVLIHNVTEQWAQIAIAGPDARTVLKRLDSDIDFTREAFPFMALRCGTLGDIDVRVFRISFSGELSYEIACPRDGAPILWQKLLDAGADLGIGPYGTEALHVLRAEKLFIAIGDETDGSVTPYDLNMGRLVAMTKPDFIGKRSLMQNHLAAPDRKQLVGLESCDGKTILPIGAQVTAAREENRPPPTPMSVLGHVTSSYWSPTLERPIAMALIRYGHERPDATVAVMLEKSDLMAAARTVNTAFYKPVEKSHG